MCLHDTHPHFSLGPYGKPADVWALGVILFILLAGGYPFSDSNMRNLFKKICAADYKFDREQWTEVSEEAKSLISKILVINPKKRLTLTQILNDPWMVRADHELALRALGTSHQRLRSFNAARKLKVAMQTVRGAVRMRLSPLNTPTSSPLPLVRKSPKQGEVAEGKEAVEVDEVKLVEMTKKHSSEPKPANPLEIASPLHSESMAAFGSKDESDLTDPQMTGVVTYLSDVKLEGMSSSHMRDVEEDNEADV